jgi:hypothetical protein
MKFVMTWHERGQGSPEAYEKAQRRILDVFGAWKQPPELQIHQFVVQTGCWDGFMIGEIDDLSRLHGITTALASFEFRLYHVIDVQNAIQLELEAMKWRDEVPS